MRTVYIACAAKGIPNALLALLILAICIGFRAGSVARVDASAPPCNNYYSDITPPENIGVGLTDPNNRNRVLDAVYPKFKDYVKDVVPNEWYRSDWEMGAYEAGALAVKTFGWYWVNHDRGRTALNGKCYHVVDWTGDQVYVAGSGTPGSPNAHDHALKTAYAVEQTWNWLLRSGGAIYITHHHSGYSTDTCGQLWGSAAPGDDMSQWGSAACAVSYGWPKTTSTYYFPNAAEPGDHIYGQWHATMSRGGTVPFTPVSVSGYTWKPRLFNGCGPPSSPFDYGAAGDIKVVGDWDGNGAASQGVASLHNGFIHWALSNTRGPSSPSYEFDYGSYGDIPVVGDWDGNGTWTVGVYGGNTWLLNNYNAPGPPNITATWGSGSDIPLPGKWVATAAPQPMTIGLVTLDSARGELKWLQRFVNALGGVDREFNWGASSDRPIAGDWQGGGWTQFGPGTVSDYYPPDCGTSSQPNQHWTQKYTSGAGGVDNQFRYEFVRP